MATRPVSATQHWIAGICIAGGLLLTVIGIRYLIVPKSAAFTFGLSDPPGAYDLHYIIGVRNIWLGLMAIGLAALHQWRGLALWFGLATIVCFADAGIAASSSGELPQVAFHAGSGLACLILTVLVMGAARRET
jgi:hypothetical protein